MGAWKVVGKSLLVLPDGSFLDIASKEGANAFLDGISDDMDYFSSKVTELEELRKDEQLNGNEIFKLTNELVRFANYISLNAEREPFGEKMPRSEIQCWLDFTIEEIKRVAAEPTWIDTGNLSGQHNDLFMSINSMVKHAVTVALAFETEFFQVLAKCIKARKGSGRALPVQFVCGTISGIVVVALESSIKYVDNGWSPYRAFRKFEATGILEQFLRCMTNVDMEEAFLVENVLLNLAKNTRFLDRSFRIGQPCGDVARAILDGRDGTLMGSPEVINRLRNIVSLVDGMNPSIFNKCGNCGRDDEAFQASSKKCGRCKIALYCSVECQRSDWKSHKKRCRPVADTKTANAMTARLSLLMNFVSKHNMEVVRQIAYSCQDYNMKIEDMVMELDFVPERDGIAPALQESPEFTISPLQHYIAGIVQPLRLYGCTNPESRDTQLDEIKTCLKEKESKTSPTGWVLANYPDEGWSCVGNPLTREYYDEICRLARDEGLLE